MKLRLKDLLEDEVDEKFYLSQEQVDKIKFSTYKASKRRIQEKDYCDTLCAIDWTKPKCVQIGQYDTPTRQNSNRYRVYDEKGISPTIQTCQGGNLQPSIRIKNGTRKGFLEAVDGDGIDLAFPKSKQRRGRVQRQMASTLDTNPNKGVAIYSPTVCIGSTQKNAAVTDETYSPTLTGSMGTGGGNVPMIDTESLKMTSVILKPKSEFGRMGKQAIETYNEKQPENNATINPWNKSINTDFLSPTITTRPDGFKTAIDVVDTFRVRKLTPKECWRLMGFDDKSFKKAERVCSNTQLYKQAGNSIVVNVLEKILEKLLQDRPWNTEKVTRSEWLDKLLEVV